MYGSFSQEALQQFASMVAQTQSADFAEGEVYDFTRCVRPDGSAYGTRGKCRKGTEEASQEKKAIDDLGSMLPKGEKIVDSKGGLHTAAGGKETGLIRERADLRTKSEAGGKAKSEAPAKRTLASSAESKSAWQETVKNLKIAKAEVARVKAETKGDKSQEAEKRRMAAYNALDKAERQELKATEKYFAAAKRERKAAMTPEQRREEREWDRTKRTLG